MSVAILFFLIVLLAFVSSNAEGVKTLTYEEITSGEIEDGEYYVIAKAVRVESYLGNYVWAIKRKDGKYSYIDNTGWLIRNEEYDKMQQEVKSSVDNGDEFRLKTRVTLGKYFDILECDSVDRLIETGEMKPDGNYDNIMGIGLIAVSAIVLLIVIIKYIHDKKTGQYQAKLEQQKQDAEAARKKWEEEREARKKATTPIKTKILDGGTSATTTKAGGVGRAIAGGIVAGPIGAVVGAATAGHKTTSTNYTVFKIWYQDGHSEVEQVEHGTAKYKKYLELIED